MQNPVFKLEKVVRSKSEEEMQDFEGPLDLILYLLGKNKMEIQDISISLICDQYMQYITEAQAMDMELAGEFIVMASELLYIKSKMLLPRAEPDEEDPRASLAEALLLVNIKKHMIRHDHLAALGNYELRCGNALFNYAVIFL